ncbi:MAG: putative nucleotidyltransferase substrate binding domain-containing protein [Propionibacteriaceae bacterium]|nr:putative nucleotidyltransferase substrate binding domain-containing protein [Propionibacteriaceae bacterium]
MSELLEIRDFLATHPPFDALPTAVLDLLPRQAKARYFRRGSIVVNAGSRVPHMFVVRSGAIEVRDAAGELVERADAGTCFGQSSIMEDRPCRFTFAAIEDTLVLTFPAEVVLDLVKNYPVVDDFFAQGRIGQAVATLRQSDAGPVLQVLVRDMIGREPVTISPDVTIQHCAQVMEANRVSAIMVIDGGRLTGIVTDRDLRRVVATGTPVSTPVSGVMTRDPHTTTPDRFAFEVLLDLTSKRVHHLPVLAADGTPIGMVTSGDLMRLEQASPIYLVGDLSKQGDVEGLAKVMSRVPRLVARMLDQDASAHDITRVISATTEALWRRLLDLATQRLGPAPVPYCWVALGSLARHEQSVVSDQDHALILADSFIGSEHDAYFAELADYVTSGLVECGFARCPGEVMATNPKWRQPLAAWWDYYRTWLDEPTADSVLHASIFFDMRPVYGEIALFETLQRAIMAATPKATRFLGHLAKHVSDYQVPLGFFRGFVLEREGEHRDTFDIKAGGINGLVDVARVFALSKGLPQVATRSRIEGAQAAGALSEETASNILDAYEFMSYVRLRHQGRQIAEGKRPNNRLNPDELSDFEKRHLRDAFGIVSKAQQSLGVSFQTHYIS